MRVLVVDDSSTMRRIIVNTLKKLGHEDTVEAGDGKEALRALAAAVPDVIVTDWNMPEMNGPQFVEAVRSQPALARVSPSGLQATEKIQPVWPCNVRASGAWPPTRVSSTVGKSHMRVIVSVPPPISRRPSGLKSIEKIVLLYAWSQSSRWPVATSHRQTVWSAPTVTRVRPFALKLR